ncbi:hypothetical protein [Erwinia psidii]|uniref:Uncharacterized protein n=1 Tax=Erwinia psidii TaxID=69224 RepID=A0A3N6SDG2_9GAMM|nr:hypothetical protein [Erwinia psidii]MCX8959224.1 hypothetical protein [Erwinia psidii]MCX8962853.1 hypothetical protein [Erwinia psidii]MCX8966000.1 hypothetical protein [Erwinia psidii]RQM36651.1 hypothetical protein EB241_18925 [Erwinia psidii]
MSAPHLLLSCNSKQASPTLNGRHRSRKKEPLALSQHVVLGTVTEVERWCIPQEQTTKVQPARRHDDEENVRCISVGLPDAETLKA